ncbi:CHASE3 domain sensor protein [Pseudonocardia sediminis]|uniref:CHASE3 domain sensor protein n=1 Tax=Pseudonocardia sediminis TaxID=1397368 RepID=A0A4Q7V887_PSEST|nr:CHASE3 domain-containing protein [Pseudonocardia sediminis]RZT89009.1 CHASE3 domain sensor protein [Pseudonocardia sediminis]
MARSLRDTLSASAQPAMRLWHRVPMRVQGRITVGLPLVAVVISACLALSGNLQRVDIETDIQRKFETSVALGELTTLMVNAETGVRGYQLTGQTAFLEPFTQASAELPTVMTQLTELASAEPGEAPRETKLGRIQELRDLTGRQLADLERQRTVAATGGGAATNAEIRQDLVFGKDLMDRIRAEVDEMRTEEQALLDDRIAEINDIRTRDYVSVAIALVAAVVMRFLAWYLFRNGIVRRVDRLADTVRIIRNGGPVPSPPPVKRDRMGELEREVHLLDSSTSARDDDRVSAGEASRERPAQTG